MAELSERRPGRDWDEVPFPPQATYDCGHVAGSAWVFGHVAVISALVNAELPDGSGELGPQWHISITRKRRRPKDTDVRRALRAFGMVGAEEDNHHPGNARHFWLPVDAARRVDCECKAEDVTIVEPDGYRYSNPRDPAECRGCDFQRLTGKPCSLHTKDSGQQRGNPVEDSPVLRSNASIEDATTPSNPTGTTAGNVTTSRDDPDRNCVVGPAAGRATSGGAVG